MKMKYSCPRSTNYTTGDLLDGSSLYRLDVVYCTSIVLVGW